MSASGSRIWWRKGRDSRLMVEGLEPLVMNPGVFWRMETVIEVSSTFFNKCRPLSSIPEYPAGVPRQVIASTSQGFSAANIDSPFFSRRQRVGDGSVEMIVPGDRADGNGGGRYRGDVEASRRRLGRGLRAG